MNRRHFLSAESAAQSAGAILGPFLPDLVAGEPSTDEPAVLRFARRAMATDFEVLLPFCQKDAAATACCLLDEIEALEGRLTVYRDDSEISTMNREAYEHPVGIAPDLMSLLMECGRITAETWGAFDISAGPLIKAWGFFRRQGRVPTPAERQTALDRVGMRKISLDSAAGTIRFLTTGMELNLGSVGKGFALDRCMQMAEERGVPSMLLHGGGSSVRAIGHQPGCNNGWSVGIRHPHRENRRMAIVHLRNRALGTSAATFQHFEYKKKRLGHLLDPRSGMPAEGMASATALAPSAAVADALATAFYVLGVEKTRLYCQTHPNVGAILLTDEPDASPIAVNVAPADFKLLPA